VQNKNEKKWFLILNRSPRGPFTASEINELLGQGLIRHNDLALLYEEGSPGSWKFLWQYLEFDSRNKEKVLPPAEILEKRQPRTEEQIQLELDQQIPVDLKSISIDDLIIKAKPRQKRESDHLFVSSRSPFGGAFDEKKRQSQNSALIKIVPLLLVSMAMAGMFLTQKTKVAKNTPSDLKSKAPRSIATKPGKNIPKARKSNPPPARSLSERPNIPAPLERDRGQIREEEILRIREAERLKEIEERAKLDRDRERLERDESEIELDNDNKANREADRGQDEEELSEDEEENQPRNKRRRNEKNRSRRAPDEQEEPSSWIED